MTPDDRSARTILLFWMPLAAQWLMMALEGPFLAAVIARLVDPTFNLAAYGVAYAFAILVESPVIMLMSATTALVDGPASYRKLRNFALALNVLATGMLVVVLLPPVYDAIMGTALGLPAPVSSLVYGSLWLLLPWPAAIGYRRFLHGILIRSGRTRRVAYGTLLRLAAMGVVAVALARLGLPGAWVGAAALSAGVVVEAVAARFMAAGAVRELLAAGVPPVVAPEQGAPRTTPQTAREAGAGGGNLVAAERLAQRGAAGQRSAAGQRPAGAQPGAPGYADIARFYYPLALTSLIGLTVQPLLTFFMGRAPSPVESLAVFPVVHALSFLFSALGLSFQEAAIALLGRHCEHVRPLARFAAGLALGASGALALVVFTPLADVWFRTVSGLPADLAIAALTPARIAVALPALSVALSFQRALLVQARATRPITGATLIELAVIAALFPLFGWGIGMAGVTAALLSFLCGRVASVGFLTRWTLRVGRRGGC